MKPLISFIGPSHRTERWREFSDSIVTNLPYEIVFITDKYPTPKDLEGVKNLRWYYSKVKPGQCFELAYRLSQGDFIVWTGDDFHYPDYGLDRVYDLYRKLNDYRKIVSFIIHQDKQRVDHFLQWEPSIILTTTALISKQAIEAVGGLADIRFPCGHWDCDLMLRIRGIGGEVIRCDGANSFEDHESLHKIEYNFGTTWRQEWDDFTNLWSVNGKTVPRKEPFVGYKDHDLFYINQGTAGKWKEREMDGTVSVILPTIRQHLLPRALDTISTAYKQGTPEIVCVSDYQPPDNLGTNVKWTVEPRQGVIHAINTAYKQCTAEYVFLTNDDSIIIPGSIDEMVKFSKANNDEIVVGVKINVEGSVHRYWGRYFAAWIFAKRSLIERINGSKDFLLDPVYTSFYGDPDFSQKAYALGIKVAECPNALIIGDKTPAHQDVDNTQKDKFYKIDQGIFIERWRHLGKFQDGDSELENVKDLI